MELYDIRKRTIENTKEACVKYCYPNLASYYVEDEKEIIIIPFYERHSTSIEIENETYIKLFLQVINKMENYIKRKFMFKDTS